MALFDGIYVCISCTYVGPWSLLLEWFNLDSSLDYKAWNEITLLGMGMWLIIHAEIKINPCSIFLHHHLL